MNGVAFAFWSHVNTDCLSLLAFQSMLIFLRTLTLRVPLSSETYTDLYRKPSSDRNVPICRKQKNSFMDFYKLQPDDARLQQQAPETSYHNVFGIWLYLHWYIRLIGGFIICYLLVLGTHKTKLKTCPKYRKTQNYNRYTNLSGPNCAISLDKILCNFHMSVESQEISTQAETYLASFGT